MIVYSYQPSLIHTVYVLVHYYFTYWKRKLDEFELWQFVSDE